MPGCLCFPKLFYRLHVQHNDWQIWVLNKTSGGWCNILPLLHFLWFLPVSSPPSATCLFPSPPSLQLLCLLSSLCYPNSILFTYLLLQKTDICGVYIYICILLCVDEEFWVWVCITCIYFKEECVLVFILFAWRIACWFVEIFLMS